MVVTFPLAAVYNIVDSIGDTMPSDQLAVATASIVGSEDPECLDFSYDHELDQIVATIPLNNCGTVADHVDGELIFKNYFTGTDAALLNEGIVTTKVHQFQAQCVYPDTAVVSVTDVAVDMTMVTTDFLSGEGAYTFEMAAYDVDNNEVTSDNKVEIGSIVVNKITVPEGMELPDNVSFHVTDCTAYERLEVDGNVHFAPEGVKSYGLIEDTTCPADLVEGWIENAVGDNDVDVSWGFKH